MIFHSQHIVSNSMKYFLSIVTLLLVQEIAITQPIINSFTPKSGAIGSSVVITGNNFSTTPSNNIVYFGAVKAQVTAATATSLTVTVPAGATYQPITVTTGGLTAYTASPFSVTFSWKNTIDNLLAEKIEVTTGLHPNDLVLSDLDGDGRSDMATANNYSTNNAASVSVAKNSGSTGNISFAQNTELAVGGMAYAINAGDFNGDGKPDLVASSIVNKTISVFKNTSTAGNMAFAAKVDFGTNDNPYSIAIADFNKDGKPDIAVANYLGNSISVFKNTSSGGNISFAAKTDFTTALGPSRLITADLDGDGNFDLATANSLSNSISVLRNTSSGGNISFAAKIDYTTGKQPQGIAAGDLDGDGKTDLLAANYLDGTISVFKNSSSVSSVSFNAVTPVSFPGNNVYNVSVGDVNGDGKPELVVPALDRNFYLNVIYVVQNTSSTGSIAFGAAARYFSLSPNAAVVGDLDNDGKNDIAAANFSNSSVSVFRNRLTDPSITSFDPATGVNGTVVTISGYNFVDVTKVSFGGIAAKTYNAVNETTIVATVDSGKSGKVSVTTINGKAELDGFLFEGPPAITSFSPTIGTTGSTISIAGANLVGATDVRIGGIPPASFKIINADTILANVGAGASGDISVQTAFGSSTAKGFIFVPPPQLTSFSPVSGPLGTTVTISGTNFSGNKDSNELYFGSIKAVVASSTSNTVKAVVPKGAGYEPITLYTGAAHTPVYSNLPFNITFPTAASIFTDNAFGRKINIYSGFASSGFSSNGDFVTGDFDGDGKNDMAVMGVKNFGYQLNVLKNTSSIDSIAFAIAAEFAQSPTPTRMAACDMDNDGKQDIIIGNQGGYFTIFRNTSSIGKIAFSQLSFSSFGPVFGVAARDLDGDGKAEVVISNSGGNVVVHRNTSIGGNLTFTEPILISYGGAYDSRLLIADLNGDSKAEIIFSSGQSDVFIYKNLSTAGNISFDAGTGFAAGWRPSGIAVGDIDGDNKPDIVASNFAGSDIYVLLNVSTAENIAFNVTAHNYPQQVYPVALSDFDGDGKPDILGESFSSFMVIKNVSKNGVVALASPVIYASVPSYDPGEGEIAGSDADGDGKPDVIEVRTDSISVFRNKSGEPKLLPAGDHPVTGPVIIKVTVDSTVNFSSGFPYVQRHYDIEPTVNPSTATAFVTLYFTQQDFDNFNATPGHGLDLPKGPGDLSGIANIRIFQYHGFSTTSIPGSYSGPGEIIDPEDKNIVWNTAALQWEVSFNVNGFSGFFISSTGNDVLPLNLLSFTGTATGQISKLTWVVSDAENLMDFVLERSSDNRVFEPVATIKAFNTGNNITYRYNDTLDKKGIYFYRLRLGDRDGKAVFSKIVIITIHSSLTGITISPNPASQFITIQHPSTNEVSQIAIVDFNGKMLRKIMVDRYISSTKVDIHDVAQGVYYVIWSNSKNKFSEPFLLVK